MLDTMYEIPSLSDVEKVVIDETVVSGGKPQIIKKAV